MIKICITKTSDRSYHNIKEYESLEACVNELLPQKSPELVVSKPDDLTPEEASDCGYVVEIYDTWRE